MARYLQVVTTWPRKQDAQAVARTLLETRLAACVQILGPIESTYWWQGQIERSEEWLCLIKTTQEHWEGLATAIRSSHPYQVPEIIALPIIAGSDGYLKWLGEEVAQEQAS